VASIPELLVEQICTGGSLSRTRSKKSSIFTGGLFKKPPV
jgi:hypothetical protein